MDRQARKVKKSFSISLEAEVFLRQVRQERRISSDSETLDLLLRELMVTRKQRVIDSDYRDYYNSLSDEDVAEQRSWGAFAETQFAEGAR